MTAPIDVAEAALRAALSARLVNAGLIAAREDIDDKPINAVELTAARDGVRLAVALVRVAPRVRRVFIGGASAVYRLDLLFNFEFAAVGADPAKRAEAEGAVHTIIARLVTEDPRLGGVVERLDIEGEPELTDAPPAAVITAIPFAAAVSAGDALGRLPVT